MVAFVKAKSKEVSQKKGVAFAKSTGGNDGVAQQGAHPAKPGQVSVSQAGKTSFGVKGGKTKMFGQMEAGPQTPGQTAPGGAYSPEKQFASGGKTKMFGFTGARAAKAGQSSQ